MDTRGSKLSQMLRCAAGLKQATVAYLILTKFREY